MRGAEELRLGDGVDQEGEEARQRHLRQGLGAVKMSVRVYGQCLCVYGKSGCVCTLC